MGKDKQTAAEALDLDRGLISQATATWQTRGAEIAGSDLLAVSAYLDGKAAPELASNLEQRLAASEELRQIWLDAGDAQGLRETVPPQVLERAAKLAEPAGPAPAPSIGLWDRLLGALASEPRLGTFGWSAAALLFLAVMFGGFELGQQGYAPQSPSIALTATLTDLPFEPEPAF
ncbi:MAG: hypothetical protein AAFY02_05960 [Pseudomonadota bacterium]